MYFMAVARRSCAAMDVDCGSEVDPINFITTFARGSASEVQPPSRALKQIRTKKMKTAITRRTCMLPRFVRTRVLFSLMRFHLHPTESMGGLAEKKKTNLNMKRKKIPAFHFLFHVRDKALPMVVMEILIC